MATREEMGKALREIWYEHDLGAWADIAETFATWLRKQGPPIAFVARSDEIDVDLMMKWLLTPGKAIFHGAVDRYNSVPILRCPNGHILTHPEDIERRYCGECRAFLAEIK